jgi:hypothetical protein
MQLSRSNSYCSLLSCSPSALHGGEQARSRAQRERLLQHMPRCNTRAWRENGEPSGNPLSVAEFRSAARSHAVGIRGHFHTPATK